MMGLERTCAVWVLALSAAACSAPARELGQEATEGATGGSNAGQNTGGASSVADAGAPANATGGGSSEPRDAGSDGRATGGQQASGGSVSSTGGSGVTGGRSQVPEAGQGGGPAPVPEGGSAGIDAGVPEGGADACVPLTYYGPPPCTSDDQCVRDHGQGWYCDKNNSYDNGCGQSGTWPICVTGTAIDAGVPDSGADACEPLDIYGPMPCTDDAQCIEDNGEGWYCDETNTVVSDTCGNLGTWPMCKERAALDAGVPDSGADACVPLTWYGPVPCTSDDECVKDSEAGWYCDKNNTIDNGCGQIAAWPVCKQRAAVDADVPDSGADACEPLAIYGPRPCTDDAECIADNGEGWYCDKTNAYDDGCGNKAVWPICREE